ncbi:hypothetical protein WJX82_004015 [Trebouxia sp. C0006]
MENAEWIVAFGSIAAFLNAFTVGANLTANCWGPVLGARVIKYRTAVLLGVICQTAGVLAFGPRTYTIFGGFLDGTTELKSHPQLTLYAIMWTVVTPVVWQSLAIWRQILVPAYLGTVASIVGAVLVFPGASSLEFGQMLSSPPFLTGLGPIFLTWLCAPWITIILILLSFLGMRSLIMRGEDTFHRVLWILPAGACFLAVVLGLFIIEVIGSPSRLSPLNLTAQELVIILAAIGSGSCVLMTMFIPYMTRRVTSRKPNLKVLRRMNFLGLDDVTVQDLADCDRSADMKGWLQRMHAWLFERDLFAGIASDTNLMRIHATAEEYESAAEDCFAPFQVVTCLCLSVAHGANNARTSVGVLLFMADLYHSGAVSTAVNIGFGGRIVGAVAMALGSLLCGFQLAPVSGVQLAKMTPFRSAVVMAYTAVSITILSLLQLKGGVITYVIVCAVSAIGFAEGPSHTNWKKVATILLWWFLGFFCVCGATYVLVAQGMYAPSVSGVSVATLATSDG